MTDTKLVAERVRAWLLQHGTYNEKDWIIGHNTYKAAYRAMSLMFSPLGKDIPAMFGGAPPSINEAAEVFRQIDPFFADYIDTDYEGFESLYEFNVQAWGPFEIRKEQEKK